MRVRSLIHYWNEKFYQNYKFNKDGAFLIRDKVNAKQETDSNNQHVFSLSVCCSSEVYNLEIRKLDANKYAIGKYKPNEEVNWLIGLIKLIK